MEMVENHSLVQTISVAAMAIIALSVGVQKLLKDWRSTDAETSVIKMMHEELERMGQQNSKLTEELTKLQLDIVELNSQLTKLNIENNHPTISETFQKSNNHLLTLLLLTSFYHFLFFHNTT